MGNKEEHGTSRQSQIAFQAHLISLGAVVLRFDRIHEDFQDREGYIKAVRYLPASPVRQGHLIVASAFHRGTDVVAFQQGTGFDDCILSFIKRFENNSLRWKEDEYANKS